MSAHVKCRSVDFHRVHVHWPPIQIALACRSSTSESLISCCTIWLLSLLLEVIQRCGFVLPSPCLPTVVVPTMYLCRSLLSARSTALLADHFLPVRVSMPAFLTKSSVDCFRVTTSLPLATLNSSTIDVNGSFSWLVLPILVKLDGTPSHLRMCRLTSRSNPSTVDVRGHRSLGNRPYWYNHALNLPGSTVLFVSFKPSCSWFLVLLMLFVSFRLTSYHFSRHLIGMSIIDGIFPLALVG